MVLIAAGKGDVICVLFGCNVPVLLRRCATEGYELVGECYLDGFMNREALERMRQKSDSVHSF
jgi:hypothetical protein